MGYAIAMSPCISCGKIFTYNPVKVPSVWVRGEREPVCRECIERANPQRIAMGLVPFVPLPGAYDACEEGELE